MMKSVFSINRYSLIFILAILNMVSFGQEKKYHFEVNQKEIRKAKDLNLELRFSNLKIIPLESAESCWLGQIKKIKKDRNSFYILSKTINEGVSPVLFVFNSEGDFVKKIGQQGKGPGEYSKILDFTISKTDGNIFILDVRKILEYDLEGVYIQTYKVNSGNLTFLPTKIESLIDNTLIVEGAGSFQLGLLDGKGNLIRKYNTISNNNIDLSCPFTTYSERTLINLLFQKSIYSIDNMRNLYPILTVDFGNLNLDIESHKEYSSKNYGQFSPGQVILTFVSETAEEFYLRFSLENEDYFVIFNKTSGSKQIFRMGSCNIGNTQVPNSIFQSDAGELIIWAEPSQFKVSFNDWVKEANSEKFKLVANRVVDEFSNPIIIVIN